MRKTALNILILEDDRLQRDLLKRELHDYGHIHEAKNLNEATKIIQSRFIDLAFVDLYLELPNDGLKIIPDLKRNNSYVVVLSSSEDEDTIDLCNSIGCNDYFIKGNESYNLKEVINKFLLNKENNVLKSFIKNEYITEDKATIEELKFLFSSLHSKKSILINGPTGIGKTILAKKIHHLNASRGKFINVNISAIPKDLIESELFGIRKGSFTGATQNKKGFMELANNGTLFLDEIGSISLTTQIKLLKALDEKEFYPVGSETPVVSNFQLITATCDNIDEKIASGQMRLDFLRRISGIEINLPPLKERFCDIRPLIRYLLKGRKRITFSNECFEVFKQYNWPYNIAELKELLENLSNLSKGLIQVEDLPKKLLRASSSHTGQELSGNLILTNQQYLLAKEIGLIPFLEKLKAEIIIKAFEESGRQATKAMKGLSIHSRVFYKYKDMGHKSTNANVTNFEYKNAETNP